MGAVLSARRSFLRAGSATGVLADHELEDDVVSLLHALGGHGADGGNGLFHVFHHQALAGPECIAIHRHLVPQDGGVHRGGDLGGAAALGAVADDAGHIGQGVGDGAGNGVVVPAVEVGDAGARAAAGADRAA